jgi:3-deoxy-D-manno-octulosonic-acid transferase
VVVSHLVYETLFTLAFVLLSPLLLLKMRRHPNLGRWISQRVLGRLPDGIPAGRPVWIHAVSVGEVKAARPLVAALRKQDPDLPLVVTTGTSTGYETALGLFPDVYVCHAPLDLPWVVRRVVARLDPRLLILVELEVWPCLMRVTDERGVPLVILNGRITERSFRKYQRTCWWLPEFDRLALVGAQDETYAHRFEALGVPSDRVVVTGNLKHDLVGVADAGAAARLVESLGLRPEPPVFLAGSTHAGEEQAVLTAWAAAGGPERSRLILVPRHPERIPEVRRLLEAREIEYELRSRCRDNSDPTAVLLVDTMGELEALFALADVVFLGGSLAPVGGHNVLEPAAAGRGVMVGPHTDSCRREVATLERAGALVTVTDAKGLAAALSEQLGDPELRKQRGQAAQAVVAELRGVAAAAVDRMDRAGLLSLHSACQ